ncbi:MAG: TonB-dependent siderophore receptor [Novosphingobium sp.]
MNGDGSYGGTINLIRKRPTRNFQASFGANVGSWETYRVDADVSEPLNADGTLRGRVVAAWKDGNAFRDYKSSKNYTVYGTIDFEPTPNTLVNFGLSYKHQEQRGNVSSNPITYYSSSGQFVGLLPRSFSNAAPWAGYEHDQLTISGAIEQKIGNNWTAKLQFGHEEIERPLVLLSTLNPWVLTQPASSTAYKDVRQYNEHVTLDVTGSLSLFGRTHEILFGAGASRSKTSLLRGNGASTSYADMGTTYADGGGLIPYPTDLESRAYAYEFFSTKRRHVYAAGRFHLADPLRVIAGIRISDYDRLDAAPTTWWNYDMKERGVITPYAGITLDLMRNISLYGSYASIFQPQSNRDVNGRPIDPEEGQTYEAGIKGELFDGRLNASANYFWMRTDNTAEAVGQYVTGTTNETAYRAVMGVKRHGYEVELSGELLPGWQAQGSFVLNSSSLRSANNSPRHQFKLNSSYRFDHNSVFNGLNLGIGARWKSHIGTGVTSYGGSLEQGAFWLFDTMARYEIGDKLTVGANVDNLFDKKYFSGLTNWSAILYTWGEPRSFRLNASVRF